MIEKIDKAINKGKDVVDTVTKPVVKFVHKIKHSDEENEIKSNIGIDNRSKSNILYFALAEHIDLIKFQKDLEKKEKKSERIIDKKNQAISRSMVTELVKSLDFKLKENGVQELGKAANDIYVQLAQIVLYLYKDENLMIENSIEQSRKYEIKDRDLYVYEIVEKIIDNISKDEEKEMIDVTLEYIKKYLRFIYKKYNSIHNVDQLKEAIVLMSVSNGKNNETNDEDKNIEREDCNLKLLFDFYVYLLEHFYINQIELKDLNKIGNYLKPLKIEELRLVIDSIKNLHYKEFDNKEAETLLNQIKDLSNLDLEDLKQTNIKIKSGKLNTTQLQKNLNKTEEKSPRKRIIIAPKIKEENNMHLYFALGGTAFVAIIGSAYLMHQKSISEATSLQPTNYAIENIDNTSIENYSGDNNNKNEIVEESYNLYYPVLYRQIDEEGKITEKQAYVGVNNGIKQLGDVKDENTIFVLEHNVDENERKIFTKPQTKVYKDNLIFPFTLAYANSSVKLPNGKIIEKGSNIYIINYTKNKQIAEKKYTILYTDGDISYTDEMSQIDINNKLNISSELIRTVPINGDLINLYGYNINAFNTTKKLALQNPVLGNSINVNKGVLVTGFSYKDEQKDEVLMFYKDPITQKFYIDLQDGDCFESDIQEVEADNRIQFIGEFITNYDMPVSNGQVIIRKGTHLDLYLSNGLMVVEYINPSNNRKTIYEVSYIEAPYIQKSLSLIYQDYPELKEYAESCLMDDLEEIEIVEDKSKEKAEEPIEVETQPIGEIQEQEVITPELIITPEEVQVIEENSVPEQNQISEENQVPEQTQMPEEQQTQEANELGEER